MFPLDEEDPPEEKDKKVMPAMFETAAKRLPPLPRAKPPPSSMAPMGVSAQTRHLKWAKRKYNLLLQWIDGRGYCGYATCCSLEGMSRKELVLKMHTAVAPYNDRFVNERCWGRHCSGLRDTRGHIVFTAGDMAARAQRYLAVITAIEENRQVLEGEHWFELDDARILSVLFDCPYLMILQCPKFPIRLYDGPDIHAYASAKLHEDTWGKKCVRKGFAYSPGHFNALVLS